MHLTLNRNASLPIKEQIKDQVRALVRGGALVPGQALPPSRDLAVLLGVNRNTTAAVYKELAADGLVYSVVGSGTFVAQRRDAELDEGLETIIDAVMEQAVSAGYAPDRLREALAARLALHSATAGRCVLVVECNHEALEDIAATLRVRLGVVTRDALIQDLEHDPDLLERHLRHVDLVVCGFNHVEEFHDLAPRCPVDVVGVMLRPNVRILAEFQRLPKGARVGFACANQRSARSFYKSFALSGNSQLTVAWLGMDDQERTAAMLGQCGVIFATHYVAERVAAMAGSDTRVVRVDLGIDSTNVARVRERLLQGGASQERN